MRPSPPRMKARFAPSAAKPLPARRASSGKLISKKREMAKVSAAGIKPSKRMARPDLRRFDV